MANPNLHIDPKLLKIEKEDDEIKDLKNKTEKHDYERISKSLKIDSEYYKIKLEFNLKESKNNFCRIFNRIWISYWYFHNVIIQSQLWYSIN